MSTSFDPVAYGESTIDFYDLLYPAGEVPGIVDFIRKRVTEGSRIVELGAGTGRVAVPLAESGYAVHAVDAAPAMLKALRVKDPAGLVSVHQADFTRDVVGRDFDLCLIVKNTLFMMQSQEQQCTVLRRSAESRYCWPAELDLMAKGEGFELVERWGDWEGSAFGRSSDRYVSVYRKKS
ncbi:class I SAM-dependent methyltransferase [Streptomyces sp. DT195]|uniref:class I SAM-dependent methyltransferase n=1 Tax=Streptomyces sp. DT195 TaxID=3393419 RepID=UPI003CED79CD